MFRQPTVGNELTGANKVLLMVVIPRESNEFLPTCKLRTYELLAAAILLFLISTAEHLQARYFVDL